MVKIRLAREGKKNDPFYRVVAIDSRKKREGKNLAILGYWHPRKKELKLKKDEIQKWVKKGAQVSMAVKKLMEQ